MPSPSDVTTRVLASDRKMTAVPLVCRLLQCLLTLSPRRMSFPRRRRSRVLQLSRKTNWRHRRTPRSSSLSEGGRFGGAGTRAAPRTERPVDEAREIFGGFALGLVEGGFKADADPCHQVPEWNHILHAVFLIFAPVLFPEMIFEAKSISLLFLSKKAMSPKYKLIYFNARGRAEHIRFIFAYAGVDYVDERLTQEQWQEYKKNTPFGLVPVLEIDGKTICQSNAIARHLAKKYDLAGRDEWEALQCDVLVDTLSDVKQALMQFRTECDPIKKEEKKVVLMKETIPFYMDKFEAMLNANNGFSVGESITWADFVFASSLENFECIFGKTSLDQYAGLKALKNKVFNLPGIKEWITKRPVTEF